jgi:organic hydroperoxide reductase OsmC/OhrA
MQPYPHRYTVSAEAEGGAPIRLASAGLADLESAPPAEFDGPGDRWSPETLLVGAVADCFVLTFRAVARNSRYAWARLRCEAEGVLDRTPEGTRFTELRVRASLEVPPGSDAAQGERLLARAEKGCLISSSLKAPVHLEAKVQIAE